MQGQHKFFKTCIYLIAYLVSISTKTSEGISLQQGINMASDIRDRVKKKIIEITQYEHLEKHYQNLYEHDIIKLKILNVSDVSLQFRDNLQHLLMTHIETVLNIKKKAEDLHSNYIYDEKIEPFQYFNRKNQPENFVKMELTFSHTRKVNINKSYVQVPTDIYRDHKKILNDAKWSEPINNVFRTNIKNIPSLLWQYFGGDSGMFRSFPGKNTPWNATDLYDCRRRLWYNQAINSPKDILIALDLSGSMTGAHFDIAKVTIKALIDTLQQDDFFYVLYQNKKQMHNIQACSDFMQATSQNKNAIKSAIDNLPSPNGESDMVTIFKSAFKIIRESYSSEMTSGKCSQAIMIITDGLEHNEELADTLSELNSDGDVVIFSYIIGSGRNDKELKRIACSNGGMHYHFLTVGNVWNGVLQYQKVLSKPIANSDNSSINFTPLYLDSGGLGMMTTISALVLSKPSKNSSIRKLLGVASVDIRVTLLEMQYPFTKLGVFGHAFAINNNGLFLIHPKFQDQSGYLPDPATVFLNEIEYTTNSSRSVELMIEMIDRNIDCMDAELDWFYLKNLKRVVRLNFTYCYHPINQTPFRSGVSIPINNQIFISINQRKLHQYLRPGIDGLITDKVGKYVEIAKWLFCDISAKEQENQPASIKFYPRAYELNNYLKNNNNTDKCDKEMLSSLIFSSAIISNFTETFWSKDLLGDDVFKIYIVTSSGYMTSLSYNNIKEEMNRDILTEPFYAHPASFISFKHIRSLVFTVPLKERTRKNNRFDYSSSVNISIGTAVYIPPENVLVGVAGMTVSSDFLTNLLFNASSNSCIQNECNQTFNCNHIDNYQCYLIDENGYVVTSNQGNHDLGVFFGFVNGFLMREFVNLSIYEERYYNDTQAQCEKKIFTSTSRSFQIQTLYVYVIKCIISFLYTFIDLFTSNQRYVAAADFVKKNVGCTKQILIHTRTVFNNKHFGTISYPSKCKQSYIFVSLEDANLALVVVENDCLETPDDYVLSNEPVKIVENRHCDRSLKYRRTLATCHKLTASNVECSWTEHEEALPELESYITISFTVFLLLILVFFVLCS